MKDDLKLIVFWVLFSSIAAQCSCQNQALRAEVNLAQTTVRSKEALRVVTTIYNVGETEQTVGIWTCSFPEQWRTDNSAVKVDSVDCWRNYVSKLKLKPGEKLQRSFSVHIEFPDDQIGRIVIRFRLGFRNAIPSEAAGPDVNPPPLWSNTVEVFLLGKS